MLATIGRNRAVAEIGRWKFTGFFAWVLWSFVHIYGLIGFRSRFVVGLSWLWAYVTWERGTRSSPADGPPSPMDKPESTSIRDAA
jgi:NADH dehydrogenase